MPGQICPLMSSPKEPKVIIGPAGAQKHEITGLVPCVGPQCAMYISRTDGDGNIVGGSCSIVALPSVMSELVRLTHTVARAVSPNYAQADDDAINASKAEPA